MPENPHESSNEVNAINAAIAYSQGMVCPAEMWRALFEASRPDEPLELLNRLSPEVTAVYREAIADRPESFDGVAAARPAGDAVRRWLLER